MVAKDDDTEPDKKTDRPRKKKAVQKKGKEQPYAGTHGYTEEEIEGMVKGERGRGNKRVDN